MLQMYMFLFFYFANINTHTKTKPEALLQTTALDSLPLGSLPVTPALPELLRTLSVLLTLYKVNGGVLVFCLPDFLSHVFFYDAQIVDFKW